MVSTLVAVHAQDRVDGEIVSAGGLVKTFSIEPGQSLILDQMSFDRFKAYEGCEGMQLSSRPDQFAKGFKLKITTGFVVDGRMALAFSYTEVIPKVLRSIQARDGCVVNTMDSQNLEIMQSLPLKKNTTRTVNLDEVSGRGLLTLTLK